MGTLKITSMEITEYQELITKNNKKNNYSTTEDFGADKKRIEELRVIIYDNVKKLLDNNKEAHKNIQLVIDFSYLKSTINTLDTKYVVMRTNYDEFCNAIDRNVVHKKELRTEISNCNDRKIKKELNIKYDLLLKEYRKIKEELDINVKNKKLHRELMNELRVFYKKSKINILTDEEKIKVKELLNVE